MARFGVQIKVDISAGDRGGAEQVVDVGLTEERDDPRSAFLLQRWDKVPQDA